MNDLSAFDITARWPAQHQLAKHRWVAGEEYTIADIAIFPWVNKLVGFYDAGELVGIQDFPRVMAAVEAFRARPAVAAGLKTPA